MDWSDDLSSAVHDLDDFFRAGLLPRDRLARDQQELDPFLNSFFEDGAMRTKLRGRLARQADPGIYNDPVKLSSFADDLVAAGTELLQKVLLFPAPYEGMPLDRIRLRETGSVLITRYIKAPRGQFRLFPPRVIERPARPRHRRRSTVWSSDYISAMTEATASDLWGRISGAAPGSITDLSLRSEERRVAACRVPCSRFVSVNPPSSTRGCVTTRRLRTAHRSRPGARRIPRLLVTAAGTPHRVSEGVACYDVGRRVAAGAAILNREEWALHVHVLADQRRLSPSHTVSRRAFIHLLDGDERPSDIWRGPRTTARAGLCGFIASLP